MSDLPSIYEYGGEPVTTSRAIAEQFGKQHQHIIRNIESIISELNGTPNFGESAEGASKNGLTPIENVGASKIGLTPTCAEFSADLTINREFAARNFFLTEYTDTQGKRQKQYILTRDGFTLLAMGFTGAKAMQFKVAYINAFNRMEQLIRGKGAGLLENAQRAAAQLGAVEDIAGAGKDTAADEVASQTLRALRAALESGAVTLRRKRSELGIGESNCIGSYDYNEARVLSSKLYALYSESLASPLPYNTWHALIRYSGRFHFSNYGKNGRYKKNTIILLSDIPYTPKKKG